MPSRTEIEKLRARADMNFKFVKVGAYTIEFAPMKTWLSKQHGGTIELKKKDFAKILSEYFKNSFNARSRK